MNDSTQSERIYVGGKIGWSFSYPVVRGVSAFILWMADRSLCRGLGFDDPAKSMCHKKDRWDFPSGLFGGFLIAGISLRLLADICQNAAVHIQYLAVHEVRGLACQEHCRAGQAAHIAVGIDTLLLVCGKALVYWRGSLFSALGMRRHPCSEHSLFQHLYTEYFGISFHAGMAARCIFTGSSRRWRGHSGKIQEGLRKDIIVRWLAGTSIV